MVETSAGTLTTPVGSICVVTIGVVTLIVGMVRVIGSGMGAAVEAAGLGAMTGTGAGI
jgi:hypothetical protein